MKKRIGSIALALFISTVSCNVLGNGAPSNSQNANGPSLENVKPSGPNSKPSVVELSENIPNIVLNSIDSGDTGTKIQSKYNFIDSSTSAMTKLRSLIESGKYKEIFGNSLEEINSRILAAGDQITAEGLVSQQSHSHALNANHKNPAEKTFFYSSNPDQHTSQNCYIVKMKPSVEKSVFEKLSDVFGAIDAKIYKRYQHGFLGYSICFPENTLPLSLMKEISAIEFVERDNVIKASQIQEDAPWGLARLSSPDPKSSYYGFDGTGQGVTVYVIDSGLSKINGKITILL